MVMGMSRLVQINSRLVAVVNLTHQSIAKPSETNKVQVLFSSNGLLRLPPYISRHFIIPNQWFIFKPVNVQ